jgi:short-subunit dehydrogenase
MSALCPGPVDTGFAKQADTEGTEAFKNAAHVQDVAHDGFNGMEKGELIIISGLPLYYRFLIGIMPLLPRSIVLSEAKKAISKTP